MIVVLKHRGASLLPHSSKACFSYDHGELKKLELKVKRKLQVLRMFSELKEFDYEAPSMSYDKKTGEINIEEGKADKEAALKKKSKKMIGSMDDLEKERKALFAEVGLDEAGQPKDENEPIDKVADKLKLA